MTNGNIEYEYSMHKGCHYFFEVDPRTELITKWRFEGSENDCQIPD